ncbi:MAG: hypothetical protein IPG74_17675 [Flavobacteriales bacterium]|nr:hypothetical protein [Flavobacteriales bacterium]MBK7555596.1 hypothetical protein [Flavobacteriales bacterium]MBK9195278.1 hypothetical protein [Flavobacteriales bacterium]MBP6573505.1 hypothetical protein [Flavobacteriales bacterium]
MELLTIRAFRAVDEPWSCGEFAILHAKVLRDFGIEVVADNGGRWHRDPNIVVVIAEHPVLGMVGGCRLHLAHRFMDRLPVETSIGSLDPRVRQYVEKNLDGGVMEIGGLWNSNDFAGRGLPHLLVMVGISLSNQLNTTTVFGVAAKYTLRYAVRLGLPVVEEVGNLGWFDYPKPGFYGILAGTTNSVALNEARPDLRRRILSLRARPNQRAVENTGVAELDIQYALKLSGLFVETAAQRAMPEYALRHSA